YILRLLAFIGTLGSAIAMATTTETLPFLTQFIRFSAQYDDLPTLIHCFYNKFLVIANGIVSAYLLLSLPLSIFHIMRSAMLALLTARASAAAAIVYLAHKGNARVNWLAICQQFQSFCEPISGSLIGSFGGIVLLILLIMLSGVSLSPG
ncbi:DUF588 domain-containing protein, partial [Cephalotus follicularis]